MKKNVQDVTVHTVPLNDETDVKLNVQGKNAQIKLEVNTITRGHIFPPQLLQVVDSGQEEFGKFAVINVVALAELYGGKICAAINRQHPRDVFDVKLLFENEGITNEIWDGVKIGLISHYKPIYELLFPILKDQKSAFDNQFAGMTLVKFSYDDYIQTRTVLIEILQNRLTADDIKFLLSFEQGEPDWNLFPLPILKDLPAIKWKLLNFEKLKRNNPKKHNLWVEKLSQSLEKK